MNQPLVDKIAAAILYEGYILYPYRRSTKNHHRWTFGCLFPRDYTTATDHADPHQIQSHFLVRAPSSATITIQLRFLQLIDRTVAQRLGDSFTPIDQIELSGKRHQSWQEAVERSVTFAVSVCGQPSGTSTCHPEAYSPKDLAPHTAPDSSRNTAQNDSSSGSSSATFSFPYQRSIDPIESDYVFLRTQHEVRGTAEAQLTKISADLFHLTLTIQNTTPLTEAKSLPRERAQLHAMASTHAVVSTDQGSFISLHDPPEDLKPLADSFQQQGAWPVLIGDPGSSDTMLASPIILYDHPQIAPESPGDLFDGTEIDEILSLRIMTLTDEEKQSAADLDPRAASLLKRTDALARDQLMRLHGTMRPPRKIETLHIGDRELGIGDHVRLRPKRSADAFDIILAGKLATIVAIEQDFENRIHVAVTIDDDPGADIGAAGKIGHRFFYSTDEIEPLETQSPAS